MKTRYELQGIFDVWNEERGEWLYYVRTDVKDVEDVKAKLKELSRREGTQTRARIEDWNAPHDGVTQEGYVRRDHGWIYNAQFNCYIGRADSDFETARKACAEAVSLHPDELTLVICSVPDEPEEACTWVFGLWADTTPAEDGDPYDTLSMHFRIGSLPDLPYEEIV